MPANDAPPPGTLHGTLHSPAGYMCWCGTRHAEPDLISLAEVEARLTDEVLDQCGKAGVASMTATEDPAKMFAACRDVLLAALRAAPERGRTT